jgi:type VI secretion system secreted protein Hcp
MEIYLEIEGIRGSVTESAHREWIKVRSIEWDVTRDLALKVGSGSNREAGVPKLRDIRLTKDIDAASPRLFQEACLGKSGLKARIHFVETNEDAPKLEYIFNDTLISVYGTEQGTERAKDGGFANEPMETIALSFSKFEMSYIPRDTNNRPQAPVRSTYNLATARAD